MNKKIQSAINIFWYILLLSLFIYSIFLVKNDGLKDAISDFGIWAPVVIVLLKISTLVIAPLGGTPIYIISGVLFGPLTGFFICLLGDILGSSICFFISRRYGRNVVVYFSGGEMYQSILRVINIITDTKSFIKARLALFSIPEVLAYASGLSQLSFIKFIFLHSLFYVPIDFIFVFFGSQIVNVSGHRAFLVGFVFVLISMIGIASLYKDYEKIDQV
jgi:uncharacterized membrane protein YdjX (TVP38/TMEM64 family)